MKIHKKIRKGFTLVELLVVIAIMASLGAVGYVGVLAFMNAGDKQAAGTNMKQVGTALTNFKRSNGSFPCDQTVSRTEKSAGSYGDLQGDTANDYFRQLFAKRDAISEANFYAALPGIIEGDNKIANGECLKPGENAFAYVMRKPDEVADAKPAKKTNKKKAAEVEVAQKRAISDGPILFCCIKHNNEPISAEELTFDMVPFKGYAVMYTVDGQLLPLEDGEKLTTDEADDTIGRYVDDSLFPENKKTGESTANQRLVLPPAM